MRLRVAFVLAVSAGLMVAALPAIGAPRAKLIHVHVFKDGGKGKPAPAVANCSPDGPTNGLYALTGWTVAAPKTAYLNPATIPAGLGSVTATLQTAYDVWRVNGSVPRITVSATGTATRYTANRRDDIMWARTSGSSLAVTYTWRWSDGYIESDTVFNKGVKWAQLVADPDGCNENDPVYDVGNIAAHEFGHSYGLGHPAGDRFETMYAYGYSGETLKRSPGSGDENGMNALYS